MEGQKKKQYRGFPIKDFGNDRKSTIRGQAPPYNPRKNKRTKTQKDKRKRSKITRRKKISVLSPLNVSIRDP